MPLLAHVCTQALNTSQVRELEAQVAVLREQNAALQQELQMTRDAAHTMRSLSIPLDPVEAPDPVRPRTMRFCST